MSESGGVPEYSQVALGSFVEMVASREPAPSGGASVAVTVALAAALASMAARFSIENLAGAEALADRAESLSSEVLSLARADAVAYGRVLDAYRIPREDEEGRRRKVREALSVATDVPLSIAEIGTEVTGISVQLAEKGNPNLRGDALTAVTLAGAGVRAAVTLAEINLSAAGAEDDRLSRASELLATTAAAQGAVDGAGARGAR
ncbi:MAG: cyclodeaminase/cyclohydrolase family protein [Actinomycetota bacterium]|nr:cyclodeaminase/cyclohydrolase family protein [Actinomycetota bacterium]